MDDGIFNVHIDVNAWDCTRWCTDTVRESALKANSERKIPFRTGESNLRRQRAGPMLYQLNYIPTVQPIAVWTRQLCAWVWVGMDIVEQCQRASDYCALGSRLRQQRTTIATKLHSRNGWGAFCAWQSFAMRRSDHKKNDLTKLPGELR